MHVWLIAFLLAIATPAWSQGKPEARAVPAASLVGNWDITGRNVDDGVVYTPDGELRIERDLGGGRYEGRLTIHFWQECPQPGHARDDGSTDCQRIDPSDSRVVIEVRGDRVRITELDRDPQETFEYDLAGDRMRFRLDSCRCEETTFTYVRRAPGAPVPAPAPAPARKLARR